MRYPIRTNQLHKIGLPVVIEWADEVARMGGWKTLNVLRWGIDAGPQVGFSTYVLRKTIVRQCMKVGFGFGKILR